MSLKDIQKVDMAVLYPEEYLVIEDEEVSIKNAHLRLIIYLIEVLERLYQQQNWFIVSDIILKDPRIQNTLNKIVPDIDVFKGIDVPIASRRGFSLWEIDEQHPAPPVVVEVSSESTWETDIGSDEHDKPAIYGRIGVKEYFAYDPFEPQVWKTQGQRRLLGWCYENGQPVQLQSPSDAPQPGWLWSEELESWLGPDDDLLRLYDRDGNLRLTEAEAAEQRAVAETAARILADARADTQSTARQQAEQRATDAEQRAQSEAQARLEAERRAQSEAQARFEIEQRAAELQRLLDQLQKKD